MTVAKLHEYVVQGSSLVTVPSVGTYYCSPSGGSVLLVGKVRKIVGAGSDLSYRIVGSRLRKGDVPQTALVLPWPRAERHTSRAAEPVGLLPPGPIVTRAKKAKAERDRIVAIRKTYNDPANQIVDPVRVANRSAVPTDIRDIEDLNIQRRQPRIVRTYKSTLVTDALLKGGTISRRHARAATTFRNQYERAGGLGLGQSDWGAAKYGGFGPTAGLTETQLMAMDGLREARGRLGRLWEIVIAIVIEDITLREYGRRTQTNAAVGTGRLMGALDVLDALYSPQTEEKVRHTIGSQTGDAA